MPHQRSPVAPASHISLRARARPAAHLLDEEGRGAPAKAQDEDAAVRVAGLLQELHRGLLVGRIAVGDQRLRDEGAEPTSSAGEGEEFCGVLG